MDKVNDRVTSEKLKKYRAITQKALLIAKKNPSKGKEIEAKKIIEMAECYISDSIHFEKKQDLINAFGAIYYAHGWIDCGARLAIFDVNDDQLFTIA